MNSLSQEPRKAERARSGYEEMESMRVCIAEERKDYNGVSTSTISRAQ